MSFAIQKITALVPIKGYSERVSNKNLRPFAGKPLYYHIIHTLLACPMIDSICINTDSDAIAEDATSSFSGKIKIIPRPKEICGDTVSMNVIIKHDLSQIDGRYFLQTHSTNPLLSLPTLTKAIEQFLKAGDHDSLFGVNRYQSRFYDHQGKAINHYPNEMLRTQDLPPVYEENSNLYLFSRDSFDKTGRRIGNKPILFETPKLESIDIDEEVDFKLAELIYEHIT
ncbi:MAG: acylneuraminate cytidylyltransferase [Deltaproteobacteria bacterium RIFCSPLOWO2_01_44_7]|nr:MAG: acylneuraminate cytidylyltransferase [Deltaproteobacteria bacterium RIFCSPHIGHO2_01_FULL_43_49]OGQ16099.1 MAG: acylneuraminate cytidylyltransferase [Deltaproteobacteria bacterium RIFCSPHIGHO2_02_FULL_44_53]OGQ29060.1 MAG: acylneuraminate cytidylyltransferase [Deltaproteobacteria bacterium RIFCSPHIGHO2_12_FULL_44_21]OGQ32616.1 MAG: acylneuraminate cytidylyltransferase [Deltaproteobacteria bacterium RIFCSPLOWO2_01_FULL_45_74]OGQ38358.1 MAG: acylneuraminate cytidylyltransferase [Deltaprote